MNTVTSSDGTIIAYDRLGAGTPIILVDGALEHRGMDSGTEKLARLLANDFTVLHYDRRGRGDSRDTQPYAVDREIEDIEAVIGEAGAPAFVFGISSGAALAMEAAIKLGNKIRRLAMYEPPYNSDDAARQAWRAYAKELNELVAAGRPGDALARFMMLTGMPEEQVPQVRMHPMWPVWEAAAPTLAYDAAVMGEDSSIPTEKATGVAVPALDHHRRGELPVHERRRHRACGGHAQRTARDPGRPDARRCCGGARSRVGGVLQGRAEMRKVIVDITMSLDGFVTAPNDVPGNGLGDGGEVLHEWAFDRRTGADTQVLDDATHTQGSCILGRRTFDNSIVEWGDDPPFKPGQQVFVLTHRPHETLTRSQVTFVFVTDGTERALAQAQSAAGDKDVYLMGASVSQQYLQAGQVDEMEIHLANVLLGAGRPLFANTGDQQIKLERISAVATPAVTHLRYRVLK